MEMLEKKRVEFIIEAPFVKQLTKRLDDGGVRGYTVTPAISGRGAHGKWSREGMVTDAGRQLLVICVMNAQLADSLLPELCETLRATLSLVTIADVQVPAMMIPTE